MLTTAATSVPPPFYNLNKDRLNHETILLSLLPCMNNLRGHVETNNPRDWKLFQVSVAIEHPLFEHTGNKKMVSQSVI